MIFIVQATILEVAYILRQALPINMMLAMVHLEQLAIQLIYKLHGIFFAIYHHLKIQKCNNNTDHIMSACDSLHYIFVTRY